MLRLIELFAGIGSQTQALKNIGVEHKVVAIAEIDKYALQSYELLHGKPNNLGDITKIKLEDIPDCDLITYSFPCQDISAAGLQMGLDKGSGTHSSLLWECSRIIEHKMPKFLLMENVKNLVGKTHKANFDKWLTFLTTLGYTNKWKILNAVDYGAAQSRERVFVFSILGDSEFEFPEPRERTVKLIDILDDVAAVPANMYLNTDLLMFRKNAIESDNGLIQIADLAGAGYESLNRVYSPNGVCPTLTTMTGGNRQPKIYSPTIGVRRLTPSECWKLMGFTEEQYRKVAAKLSNTQLYKQAGNSICVPVLEAIFSQIF